jgi:hypothetical protein
VKATLSSQTPSQLANARGLRSYGCAAHMRLRNNAAMRKTSVTRPRGRGDCSFVSAATRVLAPVRTGTRKALLGLCIVAMLWRPCATFADDPSIAEASAKALFVFDGFGTLGIVHSSEHEADFTSSTYRPVGAGYTSSWSAAVDSLIAAQATVNFTSSLSAVLQVISEENYDDTYTPHIEWANVKYEVNPDLSIRIGRTALPIFMETDSRKVGFANPWVRPPVELYNLVGVTSNDGVDASYRVAIGHASNTVQLTAGGSNSKFPGADGFPSGSVRARRLITVSDTFEEGFFIARINYGQARVTLASFDPLFEALREFGSQGAELADKYNLDDRFVDFVGAGASYDAGHWFVRGEWGKFDSHAVLGTNSAWYISGGPRFGKVTPYFTYAMLRAESSNFDPGLSVSGLPLALSTVATQVNATLNAGLGAIAAETTTSLGSRWDVIRNVDLKLQLDHTRIGAGSPGVLSNLQPGFRTGGTDNLISISVDFVF